MTRMEYTSRVLSVMRRVTAAEREAIRAELDAHMEDHLEALLDLGYEPELAEQRTMERMGDPEEVGRELDKQYLVWWLVIRYIATAFSIFAVVVMLASSFLVEHFPSSGLTARIWPESLVCSSVNTVLAQERMDIRLTVGDDILRIVQVTVGEGWKPGSQGWSIPEDTPRVAEVLAVAYDRIPFGIVSPWLFDDMTLEDQWGKKTAWCGGQSYHWRHNDAQVYRIGGQVEVAPGDTYVTLRGDRFGQWFELQIPLPQEEIP